MKWPAKIERPKSHWTHPKIYHDTYLHLSELLKHINHYAKDIKGKVIDIGAGISPYREVFSNSDEYIKLDLNEYNDIDIVADITKPFPIKDAEYDSAVCINVLEHVNKPEHVINEMHRILKNNGTCLLSTHMAMPLHGEPYDYYRFTKYILKQYYSKFKFCEIVPAGGALLTIIQFIVWGLSFKLPKIAVLPIIVILNPVAKILDKIMKDSSLTISYVIFARK